MLSSSVALAEETDTGGMRSPAMFATGVVMGSAGSGLIAGAYLFTEGAGSCDGVSRDSVPSDAQVDGCMAGIGQQSVRRRAHHWRALFLGGIPCSPSAHHRATPRRRERAGEGRTWRRLAHRLVLKLSEVLAAEVLAAVRGWCEASRMRSHAPILVALALTGCPSEAPVVPTADATATVAPTTEPTPTASATVEPSARVEPPPSGPDASLGGRLFDKFYAEQAVKGGFKPDDAKTKARPTAPVARAQRTLPSAAGGPMLTTAATLPPEEPVRLGLEGQRRHLRRGFQNKPYAVNKTGSR